MVDDTPVQSEQRFRHSLEGLTRSLDERAALHPDPVGEAIARRAAVYALFRARARARRVKWMLAGGGAAAAAVAVAVALVFFIGSPGTRVAAVQVAAAAEAPPAAPLAPAAQVASREAELPAPPAPAPEVAAAEVPAPEVAAPEAAAPEAAAPEATAPEVTAPEAAAPGVVALQRDEVREMQARLLAFGFNPGPLDGDPGRRTQGAVMRYQKERGLAQNGTADRELLETLRQDPAPKKVAADWPATPREPSPRAAAQPPRHSDPFDFLRTADDKLSRWFRSR